MTTALASERAWAKEHAIAESSTLGNRLALWNYPIAKSALSTAHQQAIQKFLQLERLGPRSSPVVLTVRGHASDTGDERLNTSLSRDRAEKVGQFLSELGFAEPDVSWAGSAEPTERGTSGLALATNRRVEILKYVPSTPTPEPPLDLGGAGPIPKAPPGFDITAATAYFEVPIDFPLPPVVTSEITLGGSVEGTLKVKVDDQGGTWGGGLVLKNGTPSAKLEVELQKNVKGKIGFEPPSPGKPPVLKLGVAVATWPAKPEIGVQLKPNFLYVNFELPELAMPPLEIEGLHFTMTLTIKLKCEVGPGPAMIRRWGAAAVAAGPGVAAFGGVLVVCAVTFGGTYLAIQQAKEEGLRFSKLLARRDGASTRIALEIIGTAAEVAFKDRKVQWAKTQVSMEKDFLEGVRATEALLKTPDARAAKKAAWKTTFAKDGTEDFAIVRERVFQAIGAYHKEGEVSEAVERL